MIRVFVEGGKGFSYNKERAACGPRFSLCGWGDETEEGMVKREGANTPDEELLIPKGGRAS